MNTKKQHTLSDISYRGNEIWSVLLQDDDKTNQCLNRLLILSFCCICFRMKINIQTLFLVIPPVPIPILMSRAVKRLLNEYRQLTLSCPQGIFAAPIDEEKSFFEWEALMLGPDGSMYEGGLFELKIVFPREYPQKPRKY